MNDIINYIMETPENTNPAILRQKVEEYAARNGVVAKPVFFVSTNHNGYHAMAYYDNPNKLATVEEVVDAYMTGEAYFMINSHNGNKFPNKIVGFFISDQNTPGEVMLSFTDPDGYTNRFIGISGSKEEDLVAAVAKYIP